MKRWLRRIYRYLLLPLLCIVVGLIAGALLYRETARHQIAAEQVIATPNGIDLLEQVPIGGVEQWVSIRGQDRDAPIVLYVHGGPGSAMMPFAHSFQGPLERDFVMVQWDQRGAGKSRLGGDELDGVTIDRMVEDVLDVTQYLRKRFGRDKIVLLGHSWGTILGVQAVLREPAYYSAYIGVGQVVNMQDNEKKSYQYVLEEAKRRDDAKGIQALEALAPYPDPDSDAFTAKVFTERRWLYKYGGAMQMPGGLRALITQLFTAPEYSLSDCFSWYRGNIDSTDHFWSELMQTNLRKPGTTFEVPVFLVSGTQDYQVPFELAEQWFDTIDAPHKEFLWLPGAAHMPMCSQPEAFANLLEMHVLPVVNEQSRVRTTVERESPQSVENKVDAQEMP